MDAIKMSFAAETTFLFLQSNFPDFQYFSYRQEDNS